MYKNTDSGEEVKDWKVLHLKFKKTQTWTLHSTQITDKLSEMRGEMKKRERERLTAVIQRLFDSVSENLSCISVSNVLTVNYIEYCSIFQSCSER